MTRVVRSIDVDGRQAFGEHVAACFGEGHRGPRLPLIDRAGDQQRLGQRSREARPKTFVDSHPEIEQLPVLSTPLDITVDGRQRIVLLRRGPNRSHQVHQPLTFPDAAHGLEQLRGEAAGAAVARTQPPTHTVSSRARHLCGRRSSLSLRRFRPGGSRRARPTTAVPYVPRRPFVADVVVEHELELGKLLVQVSPRPARTSPCRLYSGHSDSDGCRVPTGRVDPRRCDAVGWSQRLSV